LGVHTYEPATSNWRLQSEGLNAYPLAVVEPGRTGAAISAVGSWYLSSTHTMDGGLTWPPLLIAGNEEVVQLVRDPGNANALLAFSRNAIAASNDGGVTWHAVGTSTRAPDVEHRWQAASGPQPGVVYGSQAQCVNYLTGVCIDYVRQGLIRSTDGGRSVTPAFTGLSANVDRIALSPADTSTAMAWIADMPGIYLTRDSASTWQSVATITATSMVGDPVDAATWYAVSPSRVQRTIDYGQQWSDLVLPDLGTAFDLVVDTHNADRLYIVGRQGRVHASSDRGSSWVKVTDGSPQLSLAAGSARLVPGPPATLFAASTSGALAIVAGIPDPIPALDPRLVGLLTVAIAVLAAYLRFTGCIALRPK
jgi:photosystem II stability/assembly factor-like uncharacterized protein